MNKQLLSKIEDKIKSSSNVYHLIQQMCEFEEIDGLEELSMLMWNDLESALPQIISFIEKYRKLPELPDTIVKSIKKSLNRGYAFFSPVNDWECGVADYPEDKIAIDFLNKCENKEDYLDAILVKAYYLKK